MSAKKSKAMIVGVGIDMVKVPEMERMLEMHAFEQRTFSSSEREHASSKAMPAESFAGIFAAKEAVTKAVSGICPNRWKDPRMIEVIHDLHGAPHINMYGDFAHYLEYTEVRQIFLSITHEGDCASAIAIAVTDLAEERN